MEGLDKFTRHYLAAILGVETDDKDQPLEKNYDIEDFAPEALAKAVEDCRKFQAENRADIDAGSVMKRGEWTDEEMAGSDFWLTRTGQAVRPTVGVCRRR
jgi:hypothetical protein